MLGGVDKAETGRRTRRAEGALVRCVGNDLAPHQDRFALAVDVAHPAIVPVASKPTSRMWVILSRVCRVLTRRRAKTKTTYLIKHQAVLHASSMLPTLTVRRTPYAVRRGASVRTDAEASR